MKSTNKYRRTGLIIMMMLLSATIAIAQQSEAVRLEIKWQQTIGGNGNDSLTDIKLSADGGFIFCGKSNSNISGNKSENSYGNFDFWVVKTDQRGKVEWNKTFGGFKDDVNPYVIQTQDQGYLVGGKSMSPKSGTKSADAFNYSYDFWVLKLDKNGKVQWDNTYGGVQMEAVKGMTIAIEKNGGYIIAGDAHSNDGFTKTQKNLGASLYSDYWILNINKSGKVKWDKTYGAGNLEVMSNIITSSDGGYIMGGYSYSVAEYDKTEECRGNGDFWVLKIDQNGNKIWDRVYGGSLSEYQTDIQNTADGGYILGGYSNSSKSFEKTDDWRGGNDYWIVKIDSKGKKLWDKTYGGTGIDNLYSVKETSDKGFILAGKSNSQAGFEKTENGKGGYDIWIIKTDSTGNVLWEKTIGGSKDDIATAAIETTQNEYIIGGTSKSPTSADKTDPTVGGTGENDFWIIKLKEKVKKVAIIDTTPQLPFSIGSTDKIVQRKISMDVSPNPTRNTVVIDFTSLTGAYATLKVYNNSGKTMLSKSISTEHGNFSLDLTNYANGTYYFVLISGSSSVTKKVIKY